MSKKPVAELPVAPLELFQADGLLINWRLRLVGVAMPMVPEVLVRGVAFGVERAVTV